MRTQLEAMDNKQGIMVKDSRDKGPGMWDTGDVGHRTYDTEHGIKD